MLGKFPVSVSNPWKQAHGFGRVRRRRPAALHVGWAGITHRYSVPWREQDGLSFAPEFVSEPSEATKKSAAVTEKPRRKARPQKQGFYRIYS